MTASHAHTHAQNENDFDETGEYLDELRNDHLGLVGGSPAMVALRDLIRRVARSERPILISGPEGAGKSLVAVAIHRLALGDSGLGRLVFANCSEIPERDLEAMLFGNVGRAATVTAADVVVLDEVDMLPAALQAKLVRALQASSSPGRANGDARPLSRILALTNHSLSRAVRENTFRADLLYELGVLTVPVPGLDEHQSDIPALVNHFLRLSQSPIRFSSDAIDFLCARGWPGGVRELRSLVERAVSLAREPLVGVEALRRLVAPEPLETNINHSLQALAERLLRLPVRNKLAAVEEALLSMAMETCDGNKSAAARMLGLHRKAVERKLEKYDVRSSATALPAAPLGAPGLTDGRLPSHAG
ncbi:MAG TPA: sigma 54-interacting transcriptional regulator [Polyangia bacterium]|jgi:DNA-binding NtrC family response regulator